MRSDSDTVVFYSRTSMMSFSVTDPEIAIKVFVSVFGGIFKASKTKINT